MRYLWVLLLVGCSKVPYTAEHIELAHKVCELHGSSFVSYSAEGQDVNHASPIGIEIYCRGANK